VCILVIKLALAGILLERCCNPRASSLIENRTGEELGNHLNFPKKEMEH
jgi:hypothetical protein